MDKFKKFVEVYNKKLAQLKDGTGGDDGMDIEEIGETPKASAREYGRNRKASHVTANMRSID